jgi:hypothetical protein
MVQSEGWRTRARAALQPNLALALEKPDRNLGSWDPNLGLNLDVNKRVPLERENGLAQLHRRGVERRSFSLLFLVVKTEGQI